ncbi:hypothetical protein HEB29_002599 [Streptomyces fulvorobeus]|uniref:Uncharacterized protein n=1 Tax=Streptomyces fulvorobeus TaxID=284028 RepID=A0A7Y9HBW3_9ACTN|nr:hypothetical protein [Streptomyces fulvorobeus]
MGRVQRARPLRSRNRSRVVRSALQAAAIVWHPGAAPASRFVPRPSPCGNALGRPRQAAKRVSDGRGGPHIRPVCPWLPIPLFMRGPGDGPHDPGSNFQQGTTVRLGFHPCDREVPAPRAAQTSLRPVLSAYMQEGVEDAHGRRGTHRQACSECRAPLLRQAEQEELAHVRGDGSIAFRPRPPAPEIGEVQGAPGCCLVEQLRDRIVRARLMARIRPGSRPARQPFTAVQPCATSAGPSSGGSVCRAS